VHVLSNLDLISAIRAGGEVRERVFDYWVQRCAKHFAKGEEGYMFYCALLAVVKEFCAAEGVRAFENRFMPLVDDRFMDDKFGDLLAEVIGAQLESWRGPWWKRVWRTIRPW
jgi:hypothetical protein